MISMALRTTGRMLDFHDPIAEESAKDIANSSPKYRPYEQ